MREGSRRQNHPQHAPIPDAGNNLAFLANLSGEVLALHPTHAEPTKGRGSAEGAESSALGGGNLVSSNGWEVLWTRGAAAPVMAAPAVVSRVLVVAAVNGSLFGFSMSGRLLTSGLIVALSLAGAVAFLVLVCHTL